jgi:hypothetical protein
MGVFVLRAASKKAEVHERGFRRGDISKGLEKNCFQRV